MLTVKAKVAPTIKPRLISGRSIKRKTCSGDAPRTRAAPRTLGEMARTAGSTLRTTNGMRHQRMRQRDQDGGGAQIQRRLVQRDDEAEAERHGAGRQRQHKDRVEPARAAPRQQVGGDQAERQPPARSSPARSAANCRRPQSAGRTAPIRACWCRAGYRTASSGR